MAERGGQPGNTNATKNKPWQQALTHVAERWPEPPDLECTAFMRGLRLAAFEFWKNTMSSNDISFFKEAADRFDGRSAQQVIHTGDPVNPVSLLLGEVKSALPVNDK